MPLNLKFFSQKKKTLHLLLSLIYANTRQDQWRSCKSVTEFILTPYRDIIIWEWVWS